MKKRSLLAIESLVQLLLILVVIVILLVWTGAYKLVINSLAKDTFCEASFIASAMSNALGSGSIDPSCKVNRILIVDKAEKGGTTETGEEKIALEKDYLSTMPEQKLSTFLRVTDWNQKCDGKALPKTAAYPYLDDYAKEGDGKTAISSNSDSATDAEKIYVQSRYNMDRIVADEMKRCWSVVGNGKLPLFDKWYEFFKCNYKDSNGNSQEKPCESMKDYFDYWNGKGIRGINNAARFCVLCARVKFDENVQKDFKGMDKGKYDSINLWMANNPRQTGSKQSYYEYILDDTQKESFFNAPSFEYSTDKPYAVIFVRVNMHGTQSAIVTAYNFVESKLNKYPAANDQDVSYANILRLVPYDSLSDECDYLVGSEI
jgi:hypothetical protein